MKNRNVAFEALRVIFILFMVLHHFDTFNNVDIPSFTENMKKIFFEGFVGVNFFFMLSGLGCVLGYKQKLESKEISVGDFLYNRFIKLYPCYILFLICSIFVYGGGRIGSYKLFAINVLMLQAWPISANIAFGFNGVAWCVSATMFFYLVFSILYKIDFKECVAFIALLIVFIYVNFLYHNADGYVMTALFYTNPIFRSLDFFIGWAIGLYFTKHKPVCSSLLQIISIVVFAIFLFWGIYGNISWLYKWGIFYVVPCGLLLFAFYGETPLSQKFFKGKIWLKLSSSSMVIFLSHQLILNLVKKYTHEDFYSIFIPYGVVLSVLSIIIFSVIVDKLYVKPMFKILKRKIAKQSDLDKTVHESQGGG